jgi:hypothetical protein
MTGAQIDDILAGPNRPGPRIDPETEALEAQQLKASTAVRFEKPTTSRPVAGSTSSASDDIYSRLTTAVNERGEMLTGIEESFNSLTTASQQMVAEAKKAALKSTARGWFF